MVDLGQALRPAPSTDRPPVTEIAGRAIARRRRKAIAQRRRRTTARLAAAVAMSVGIIGLTGPFPTPDETTVANGDSSAYSGIEAAPEQPALPTTSNGIGPLTTGPIPTTTPGDDPAPRASEPDELEPGSTATDKVDSESETESETETEVVESEVVESESESEVVGNDNGAESTTPGFRTEIDVTSDWDGGYCMQIDVFNDNAGIDRWQVVLDLDGVVTDVWNASADELSDETYRFTGVRGQNADIDHGSSASFGTCVNTGN